MPVDLDGIRNGNLRNMNSLVRLSQLCRVKLPVLSWELKPKGETKIDRSTTNPYTYTSEPTYIYLKLYQLISNSCITFLIRSFVAWTPCIQNVCSLLFPESTHFNHFLTSKPKYSPQCSNAEMIRDSKTAGDISKYFLIDLVCSRVYRGPIKTSQDRGTACSSLLLRDRNYRGSRNGSRIEFPGGNIQKPRRVWFTRPSFVREPSLFNERVFASARFIFVTSLRTEYVLKSLRNCDYTHFQGRNTASWDRF